MSFIIQGRFLELSMPGWIIQITKRFSDFLNTETLIEKDSRLNRNRKVLLDLMLLRDGIAKFSSGQFYTR